MALGRGPAAKERVLRAALEVLADDGMRGFTVESVARRAGASKATIYRHWQSPSALLVDAMDAGFAPSPETLTGDLRADLVRVLEGFSGRLGASRFPRLLAAFMDAAERHPELAEMHTELTRRRREPVLRLISNAAARGEIVLQVDPEIVVDLLAAPFFYRRFVAHRHIPKTLAAQVVDQVLAGLQPVGRS